MFGAWRSEVMKIAAAMYLGMLLPLASGHASGAQSAQPSSVAPEDPAASVAWMTEQLRAHLGEPFPDLRLVWKGGATSLSKHLSGRTVIFLAATDYYGSVAMAKRFREAGWRYPGYDQLVTLVIDLDVPRLRKELPAGAKAFLTKWPLPSYLADCRIYPSLFFVSAGGTFEGFQLGATEPVFLKHEGSGSSE